MKALLLIDIQNDFLPGGALAVKRGDEIVPVANRLSAQYELVVATMDWHPADHKSFASQHPGKHLGDVVRLADHDQFLWPDHCVQNTRGAELAPSLDREPIREIFYKGVDPQVDSYSGFFDNARLRSTGLAEYLRDHSVTEVHLVGLATDYCVKYTACDAVALGLQTTVVLEGIRGVELNPGDCALAIDQMLAAGVEIV